MSKHDSRTPLTFDLPLAAAAEPAPTSAPASQVRLQAVKLQLDTAVQLFGAFSGTKLHAEDFAGAVLHLAAQTKASPSRPTTPTALHDHLATQQRFEAARPESLVSMVHVAQKLQAQGSLAEAEALLRQALEALKLRHGPQDAQTLRAQNGLASLLQNQGRYGDARRLYLHTVEQQRQQLGADHLDTVATMENLGTLLFEQDELDNAAPLMHEAVLCRRRLLGDAHIDTLRSFNNLALLLQKQGKLQSAEALLRQTLATQQQVLGADHPESLNSMANLATILEDVGQLQEAEQLHAHSLRRRAALLGDSHMATLTSMNNLAAFLLAQKRPEEAARLLRQAIALAQASHATDHFFFANLQARYGSALAQVCDYEHAETHLLAGYSTLKETLGSIHQRTQRACSALVEMYRAWGKPLQAATYRQALAS